MIIGAMGKAYGDGECIVRQGQPGECMYVIQKGHVEVVRTQSDDECVLDVLGPGDMFGEMTLFTKARQGCET